MAKVIYSPLALSSLKRLYRFLGEKNPAAALRATQTIQERLTTLSKFPELGRVGPELPEYRELVMNFGSADYVARYRIEDRAVVVLAIRHLREAGYAAEE